MTKLRKWTAEEDLILVQAVKANPYNVKRVCYSLEKDLERSGMAIHQHWYVMQKTNKKVRTTFLTVGDKSYLKNRKNIASNSVVRPVKSNIFKALKKILNLK